MTKNTEQLQSFSGKSELVKVDEPGKKNYKPRFSYYTNLDFNIVKLNITIKAKVDTGSAHTVIGLGHKDIKAFKSMIKSSKMHGIAYDAQNNEIEMTGYIVDNFRLTDNIIIPKIKIWFSEQLGEKAVLGMDILSLFDFQYLRDKRSTNGTFWISNYTDVLNMLNKRMLNNELGYIDPDLMLIIDKASDELQEQQFVIVDNNGDTLSDEEIGKQLFQ